MAQANSEPGNGGSSSSSVVNQGKTPNAQQKAVASGPVAGTTGVKHVALAKGLVPEVKRVATDIKLADWYRDGKPGAGKDKLFDVHARSISEHDDKIAAIRVFAYDKTKGDVEIVPPFTKFILDGVQESHQERAQIIETFGDFYVFMYGERPPTYTFSGTLLNFKNVNWVSDFKFYYDAYLRGTKCVEQRAKLLMTYGGRQIEGFMLGFNTSTSAAVEGGVAIQFSVVVTSRQLLSFSDDFGSTVVGGKTIDDPKFREILDKITSANGSGLSDPKTSQASLEAKNTMKGKPASDIVQPGKTYAV